MWWTLELCLLYSPILIFASKSELETQCDSLSVQHVYGFGRCFTLNNETSKWDDWPMKCTDMPEGRLAILDTKELRDFIKANIQYGGGTNIKNPWIGLKQTQTSGEHTEGWTWLIGEGNTKSEPYDEEKWSHGHPKNNDTYAHCGALSDSPKYLDFKCKWKRPSVCQYGNNTSATPKEPTVFRMIAEGKRGGTGNEMATKQMTTKGLKVKCADLCVKQQTCQSMAVNQQDGTCKLYGQKLTQNQWIDDAQYKLFNKQ